MNHTHNLAILFLFMIGGAVLMLSSSNTPTTTSAAVRPYIELADSPTIAVDWSKGRAQSVTLGGSRSLTFSNGQKGASYLLIIRQDATGSRILTWPASVHWPGGTPPTLTTLAGKADYLTFFYNGVSYNAIAFAQNL